MLASIYELHVAAHCTFGYIYIKYIFGYLPQKCQPWLGIIYIQCLSVIT